MMQIAFNFEEPGVEWRRVPVALDYEVSDDGRVRRLTPAQGAVSGAERKPTTAKRGHQVVDLRVDHHYRRFHVAQLVLWAFRGPRPSARHQAAHWDGDPKNNVVGNLRWATQKENSDDTMRHGRAAKKLTRDDVNNIFAMRASGHIQQDIADVFGIHQTMVSNILRRKAWAHDYSA